MIGKTHLNQQNMDYTGIMNRNIYSNMATQPPCRIPTATESMQHSECEPTELLQSILYAKNIQEVILPKRSIWDNVFKESFIYYAPKDIVSGDFYWYAEMGSKVLIAIADCTGHGVPGAMMSVMGYTILDDIVRNGKVTDPGLVLERLDKGIRTLLKQDQPEGMNRDGMDIGICCINREAGTIEYCGAQRPLYFFTDGSLNVIKGNKKCIGGGPEHKTNFVTDTMKYKTGDTIYLFTDGFQDQFGGALNKKFLQGRLLTELALMQTYSMSFQRNILSALLQDWKLDNCQTDDVLAVGIRL